jgi:hypothetical protein
VSILLFPPCILWSDTRISDGGFACNGSSAILCKIQLAILWIFVLQLSTFLIYNKHLGDTDEEEIRNVFAILNYIAENNIEIHLGVAFGYSSSKKYQDKIKGFNDRVVMVLIHHIERYLTKIGIDMGVDEKIIYSITVQNGQVNIANDNASISATNTVGIDTTQLEKLIQAVRKTADGLSNEDAEILNSNLEVIEEEIKSENPRKGFIKTAVSGLKMLKGTAEFAAAITALIQFINPLL